MYLLIVVFFIGGIDGEQIGTMGSYHGLKQCLNAAHSASYMKDVKQTICMAQK